MCNKLNLLAVWASVLLTLCGGLSAGRAIAADGDKPNIVFIMADDLGWADVSPNNPATFYDTPNIQRLADTAATTDIYSFLFIHWVTSWRWTGWLSKPLQWRPPGSRGHP